jgi:hypothetical protein
MNAVDGLPTSTFLRHGTALGFFGGVAYLAGGLILDWRGLLLRGRFAPDNLRRDDRRLG